jgi:hypothetical protein
MRLTAEAREKQIIAVEDLLRRGIDRIATIVRMAGLGNRATAMRHMAEVRRRWRARNEDVDADRALLVEQAKEVMIRAYAILATAGNEERPNFTAQVAALNAILKAQERIAKLKGLDGVEQIAVSHSLDPQAGKDLRDAILAKPLPPPPAEHPFEAMYGVVGYRIGERLAA